jgi:hypothetical protein
MKFSITLAPRLLLALPLLLAATDTLVALDWRILVDARHATRIEYPRDVFSEVEETPDGIIMTGPDARLEMSAMTVEGVNTAADLRALIEGSEGYDNMTYTPGGSRWLVVSGYRGPDIYYEKFLISSDKVRGFSVQYQRWSRFLRQPAKVDSPIWRTIHDEDAETVFVRIQSQGRA